MTDQQHTAEPWADYGRSEVSVTLKMDDYRRARACVNGCAGMNPAAAPDLLAALELIAASAGQTLLGPDSKHHMGDDATGYHEMGANAAFEQSADIARAAIDKARRKT